ncbi:MAG TPA: gluconolaconase [Blastocatellia bacterium]|nr:gluconolaconase [Blastocatellia bacterium]
MRRVALVLLVLILPTAVSLLVYFVAIQRVVPTRRDAIGMASTLAGDGAPGIDEGPARSASFSDPFGIAVDKRGALYVADAGESNRILRIKTQGNVETIAGSVEGLADGPARAAKFNTPSGIAIDRRGNIIIADTGNNRIRKLDTRGYVSTLAGEGTAGFRDGTAAEAQFNGPIGVAADENGNILVADAYNDRIRRISPAGEVTTIAGDGAPGFADGDGLASLFDTPCGIALDSTGNVFVADTGNNAIRKITPQGAVLTVAGGTRGRRDGQGREASFDNPTGIVVTHDGFLFVTDAGSGLVRRVTPEGDVTTYAGSRPGFADGVLSRFNGPAGIAVDAEGNLYVCDASNYLVRIIVPVNPNTASASGTEQESREREVFIQPPAESPESAAEVIPRLNASSIGQEANLPWPLNPQHSRHEVTGVMGEARGAPGVALDHLHRGVDIRGAEGEPVLSVLDEKVSSPVGNWDFGDSSEGLRVGLMSYIHVRVGRDAKGDLIPAPPFLARRDHAGTLTGIRVRRGARIKVGESIGSVNDANHVHLNFGPWNAQANPLQLSFAGFSDTVAPVIEPGGIEVLSAAGGVFSEKREGRLVISGDVRIVVTAYDHVDGSGAGRKLGLYRVGYQLLNTDGTPAPGFEQPLLNLEFKRLPPGDESVRVVYAEGSGVAVHGTPTRFRYVVTNRVREGEAREGLYRTTSVPSGKYLLKVIAEDFAGNRASGKLTALSIIVDNR